MKLALICNPENRRASMFAAACASRGVEVEVVSWSDVLDAGRVKLDAPVRIDSPGENWRVESALLGVEEAEDRGRIRSFEGAYRGMCSALGRLEAPRWITPQAQIAAMFDKVETKRRLTAVGVSVPETYGLVRTFAELRRVTKSAGVRRCFVKPRHGSSASGVVALTMNERRVLAVTSCEMARADDGMSRLYNSLKLRRYQTFEDVTAVIDTLGRLDELLVEEWVPKASAQGAAFDLRVVVIDGEPGHVVMRTSRHPMTNLHLGNARGDVDALRAQVGTKRWEGLLETAVGAYSAFGDALYAGVDLAFTPGFGRVTVFEVNAFGDLLPGVVDSQARSTYEAEVDAVLASLDTTPSRSR